jgi:hypothetical protein
MKKYKRRVRKNLSPYGDKEDLSVEEGGGRGEERAISGAANSPLSLLTPRRPLVENVEVVVVRPTSLLRSKGLLRS